MYHRARSCVPSFRGASTYQNDGKPDYLAKSKMQPVLGNPGLQILVHRINFTNQKFSVHFGIMRPGRAGLCRPGNRPHLQAGRPEISEAGAHLWMYKITARTVWLVNKQDVLTSHTVNSDQTVRLCENVKFFSLAKECSFQLAWFPE